MKMKNEIKPEKWDELFEWDVSLKIKPYIASEFLENFILFFTLPDLLNDWAKTNYNLNYDKLPEELIIRFLKETFAFGIRFYRLVEIETKSFFRSEEVSFASLVDATFDAMFSFDTIYLEKYKEVKSKYSEVSREEIFNLFEASIRNILNSSFSNFPPTPIEPNDETFRNERILQSRLKKFPFFVGEAVVDIFDWASRLNTKEANRIFAKIREMQAKGEVNLNKEKINFLEVYGFGTAFWRKCGLISLFDSFNKVGKKDSFRILRWLFVRLWR